jgi:hypothetical protein
LVGSQNRVVPFLYGRFAIRYFKRYWDDIRGDNHNEWGYSWWFFEMTDSGIVVRQIEVYDHGPTLRYDALKLADKFGGLSDGRLELADWTPYEIASQEFENAWNS